jgi:hypothetical protein
MACMSTMTDGSQTLAEKRDRPDWTLEAELAESRAQHRDFDACLARENIVVPHDAADRSRP